jgi:hypothetical protein
MPRSRRPATIADAMILTVGAAVSFACWRYVAWMPIWSAFRNSRRWYYLQALGTVAFLAPMSLSLLVVALRPPRPRIARVAAEPAGVVGFSTLLILAVDTAILLVLIGLVGFSSLMFTSARILFYCRLPAEQTGMTIGAAWFIRALSGRCRRPSGWIDFAAIALGACWIVLAVASIAFTLM